MYVHIWTKVLGQMMGEWDVYIGPHKVTQVYMQLCKMNGTDGGVMWMCIHVLMHLHILIKMWVTRGIAVHAYRGIHVTLQKGEADMQSQVDIHMYNDVCRHSNQGTEPEEESLGHTLGTTQGSTCLHTTMERWWSRHGESAGQAYMYWCMYTF